ncbi:hypothetical protein Q8W37_12155 [Shimia thalassica]|nr:hypothetical protein [Shimia thalassica]
MLVRRVVNFGVNAGVKAMSSGTDSAGRAEPQQDRPQRSVPNNGQQTAKQAKQAMRMARRMGRF